MIIERDIALQNLSGLLERAGQGHGAIALIRGEAGMGKTSLLQHYRRTIGPTIRVLWGACDPLHTPRVLGPIQDMRADLGPSVRSRLDSDPAHSQLFAALYNDLDTAHRTTLMVIDDAHWADHATIDFLKFIGRRISFLKLVLVITYRHDEVGHDHPLSQLIGDLPQSNTHRIDLTPISPEGVAAMAAQSGHLAKDLYEITGGNPFFVTELLAVSGDGDDPVPASVRDAVGSRLNRLPQKTRAFLETLSVIPYAIDTDILEVLFGPDGLAMAQDCVARNLLVEETDGLYRFRHELARIGTLDRLPKAAQTTVHIRLLDAFLADDQASYNRALMDQIVFHAAAAGREASVLDYAPKVAQLASLSGAHREAAAHLATALDYVDQAEPELAASLYERWAYEAGLVQIDDPVIEARRKAIDLWRGLDRPDKIGENLRWLARLHWYRGEAEQAEALSDEAVAVFESIAPSSERAMAYSLRSQLHMLNDRMVEAVKWGRKALDLEAKFESVEVRIHALNNIGTAMVFRDQPEGKAHLQTSLALAIEYELHEHAARVYTNLSGYAVEFRDFELAEKTIADGIAFDTTHDLDSWTHYLIGYLAQLRMEQGRLEEAETISNGVTSLDRQTLLMKLPARLVLAKASLRLGRKDTLELGRKALDDALSTGEVQYIVPNRLNLIETGWTLDKPEIAREQVEALRQVDPAQMSKWFSGELAVWVHRLGLPPLTPVPTGLPEPYALELKNDPVGAADAWLALDVPYSAALSLMNGHPGEAQTDLPRALEILEVIYASGGIRKIRKLAQATGIQDLLPPRHRGPYKSARQHPLGLTRREQEIFPLIMDGSSNKDIAQRLSRSQRTVEHHVSSILKKLNVGNRMEALLRIKNEPWLLTPQNPADPVPPV